MTKFEPQPIDPSAMMRQIKDAFAPLVEANIRAVRAFMTAMRPAVEWAERHPDELARWQVERDAEALLGSCHCLCGTHREEASGVCVGVAAPGLSVHYDSPTVGPTDVPLCRPCYDARLLVAV